MKKLLALVLVAALYLPCYGAPLEHNILVYKFTCSFNPWIGFTDGTRSEAVVSTLKTNGYIIFDVDLTDPNNPTLHQDPNIIFYGKNGDYKWGTYFYLSEIDEEVGLYIFDIDAKGNTGLCLYIDEENDYDYVHNVFSLLYGKIGSADIGRVDKVKKRIPSSLKGIVEDWADGGDYFEAFGNIKASLDSKYTKSANQLGQTQDAVSDAIIAYLGTQGYFF